jgi:DNA repair protein RadC
MKYKSTIPHLKIVAEKTEFKKEKIISSRHAAEYARQFYQSDINIYESFFLLLLNTRNIVTGFVKISQGGTIGTVVDKKILLKYIIDSLTPQFIVIHNHPSGYPDPSQADIRATREIRNAAQIIDSNLVDHIILSEDDYYSLADNGEI